MAAGGDRVRGVDVALVEAAVRKAEAGTTGEIRVALSRLYFWGDVRRAARHAFRRLRMDRTRQRNGTLIFVAPLRHALAIIADDGIAERTGPAFWRAAVDAAIADFRTGGGDLTAGIVRAVDEIGRALARHFPAAGANPNELPDSVVVDR